MNTTILAIIAAVGGAYWWYENKYLPDGAAGVPAPTPTNVNVSAALPLALIVPIPNAAPTPITTTNANASTPNVVASVTPPTALTTQVNNATVKRNLKDLLLARGLEVGMVDPVTKLAFSRDWNWVYNNITNVQGNYINYFPTFDDGATKMTAETFIYIVAPTLGLGTGLGALAYINQGER